MTWYYYISTFVSEYEKYLAYVNKEPVPCSTEEVNEFESCLPNSYCFPLAYREFLVYGGRNMPGMSSGIGFSIGAAKFLFSDDGREDVKRYLEGEGCDESLPPQLFVITEFDGAGFMYFMLDEDDDPPVYFWKEGCGGGLDSAQKEYDSFSDFLMGRLRLACIYLMGKFTAENVRSGQPPRGQLLWHPTKEEKIEGLLLKKLKDYFGFAMWELEESAQIYNLSSEQYLEELSGWEAKKLGSEIRFFPPSN